MLININVANKRPTVDGTPIIVCGNSDYQIQFTFDEEWDKSLMKHARFAWRKGGDARYIDVPFLGDTVDVPMLTEVRFVYVGVYTDHLQTTTPARIACEYSIRCNSGEDIQEPTPEDVLVELFNLVTSQQADAIAASQAAENASRAAATTLEGVKYYAEISQGCAEEAVLATAGKQNKLAWISDADIEAMFAGTYEGTESTDPEEVDSPLPIEVFTEAEMTALLETSEVGSIYKYAGETTDTYENGALYIVSEE